MNDSWVLERSEFWWEKLNATYGTKYELPTIEISDRKTSLGGYCKYKYTNGIKDPEITLYDFYIQTQGEKYDSTIGHELAHAHNFLYFSRHKSHGPEWKQAMISIGLPPVRCHNYDIPGTHTNWCPCGKKLRFGPVIWKKMNKSSNYYRICRNCRRHINIVNGVISFNRPLGVFSFKTA